MRALVGIAALSVLVAPAAVAQATHLRRVPVKSIRSFKPVPLPTSGTTLVSPPELEPPLVIEPNVGQVARDFGFVVRGPTFAAGFSPSGITAAVLRLPAGPEREGQVARGNAVQLLWRGAGPGKVEGEQPLKASLQLVRGNDRSRWKSKLVPFAAVRTEGLWPGVHAVAHGTGGRLAYGFVLEPDASIDSIRIGVRGTDRLELDGAGNLRMVTSGGVIVQAAPRFLDRDREVKGRFVLRGKDEYGFAVERRTPGARLAIDPEIVFSTYFGGSGDEVQHEAEAGAGDLHRHGFDLAVEPDGHVLVVGSTFSADFPATAGALSGGVDAFVLRLDPTQPPDHQVVYATFLGGSSFERGVSISPGDGGTAYVVGCTTSTDFPTTPGTVQPTGTASVGFLVRLGPDGTLQLGTRIGHSMSHHPTSVVFSHRAGEPKGFVYVAGSAEQPAGGSTGDALPSAFQPQHHGGGFDGFVMKLDAELTQFQYFTYLGGARQDLIMDLAVNDGFAFVTGSTTSFDFPVSAVALQGTHSQAAAGGTACDHPNTARGCFDAFVTRLSRDGASVVYSTYFGGNDEEFGRGIGVTTGNQATFTGAARPTSGDATTIFVARLEGGGENLIWQTPLTARKTDHGEALVVDPLGRAHVVGTVSVDGLSRDATHFSGGASDIFYARFAAQTGDVEVFTYLGGSGEDRGFGIATQGTTADRFCAFIAGSTTSHDVQTVAPLPGGDHEHGRADLLLASICNVPIVIDGSSFHKAFDTPTITAGGTGTFTLRVDNGGDDPAPITMNDAVPPQLTVTSVQGAGCAHAGNSIHCATQAQPGPNTALVTVRAGSQCPQSVTNTATITAGPLSFSSSANVQVVCPPPTCGNGRLDPGEQCDWASDSTCRRDCTRPRCGDGRVDPDQGEKCDEGPNNGSKTATCSATCQPQVTKQCTPGGTPCVQGTVCGSRCGATTRCALTLFGLCFFPDTTVLCSTPQCLPPDEASHVGP